MNANGKCKHGLEEGACWFCIGHGKTRKSGTGPPPWLLDEEKLGFIGTSFGETVIPDDGDLTEEEDEKVKYERIHDFKDDLEDIFDELEGFSIVEYREIKRKMKKLHA